MQMSLNKHKRFTTQFKHTFKGSQVQLKLRRIHYKGLLHTVAKTGATGFGRSRALRLRPVPLKSGSRFHRVLTDRADRI
jgi:hypothetical protein